jgi:hypothetical protein
MDLSALFFKKEMSSRSVETVPYLTQSGILELLSGSIVIFWK